MVHHGSRRCQCLGIPDVPELRGGLTTRAAASDPNRIQDSSMLWCEFEAPSNGAIFLLSSYHQKDEPQQNDRNSD